MMMLANKFRPQTFDEIIGQEYICQILKNAIKQQRIANAYLFSGSRGCGKTSMARIFAKALNCTQGPTVHPCGTCYNCVSIANSNNIDVLEIDGASNNGIDEIRSLVDNTKFANANSCYKIYIIDEAHQITIQAFNALLKTMEEPPKNVIFILATTVQNKIPITILSRCQIYRFMLISPLKLNNEITKIAHKEKLNITSEAINVITSHSGGSMRDALNILDQIINLKSVHEINGDEIRKLLGFPPQTIVISMVNYIADENINAILHLIAKIYENGYNILQFVKSLKNYLRILMLYSIDQNLVKLNESDKKTVEIQKTFFSLSRHIRISNLLTRAIKEMKVSDTHLNIILEIYLIKIAEPYCNVNELITKIDKLIKQTENKSNSIVHEHNLMDTWNKIVDKLITMYPLTAQSLKNISIEISEQEHYIVHLYAHTQFDYDATVDFQNIILKLFKEYSNNLNIKILIKYKKKQSDKNNNVIKNNTENIPKYILDTADKFKSKIIKIFNK
jgi:DNA polymerase-3 subunit gamma/tau